MLRRRCAGRLPRAHAPRRTLAIGGGYMMTGHVKGKARAPRLLVTGAVGQVGAELVPYLREVFGASNVIASDVRQPPDDLYQGGPFQYVDVLETTQLSRLIVEEHVDTVVHLAAILSATGEQVRPAPPPPCPRVTAGVTAACNGCVAAVGRSTRSSR